MAEPETQRRITHDFLDAQIDSYPSEYDRPVALEEEKFIGILKQQFDLNDTLQRMEWEIERLCGNTDVSLMRKLLSRAQTSSAAIHQFLDSGLDDDLLKLAPTEASASKALRVFETAELAEMIFVHLHARDAMRASEVCRPFAAAIAGSSKLQTIMCYQADSKSRWRSNFDDTWLNDYSTLFRKFSCWISDPRPSRVFSLFPGKLPIEACLQMSHAEEAFAAMAGDLFPNVPNKYCTMLICQPPITKMYANASCCSPFKSDLFLLFKDPDHASQPPLPLVVESPTGLTFNDLLRVAKRLYVDHQACPYAGELLHDAKGRVHPDIEFKGQLQLDPQDPVFAVNRAKWNVRPSYQASRSMIRNDSETEAGDRVRHESKLANVEEYYDSKKHGKLSIKPISQRIS